MERADKMPVKTAAELKAEYRFGIEIIADCSARGQARL